MKIVKTGNGRFKTIVDLTPLEIKEMVEYAIEKGFKFRSRNVRYAEDGRMIYTYKARLAAIRFAAKMKFELPREQERMAGTSLGVHLVLVNGK